MEVAEQLEMALRVPGEDQEWLQANWLAGASVTASVRAGLVDWLVEVSTYLGLSDITLYLAVSQMDLVLSRVEVEELQLLGLACIGLAAKVEEDYVPSPELLLPLAGGLYIKGDLARMERHVLSSLQFRLRRTTAATFLHYFTQLLPKEAKSVGRLARAILDLSLLAPWHGQVRPSHLAGAVLTLANCILQVKVKLDLPLSLAATLLQVPFLLSKDLYLSKVIVPPCTSLLDRLLTLLQKREQMQGVDNKHAKVLCKLKPDSVDRVEEEMHRVPVRNQG